MPIPRAPHGPLQLLICLLILATAAACRSASGPPALPQPEKPQFDWSTGPDTAFVWTVQGEGASDPAPRWKTYRMTRSAGAWSPSGVRDGLWLAVDGQLAEIVTTPFSLEAMEPPGKDDPGIAGWPDGCEHVLAETDRMFSASGNGFDLRKGEAGTSLPLLAVPVSLSDLGWPRIFRAGARVLATLGPMVFLISDELTLTCEGDQFRSAIFTIFDAAGARVLLSRNIEITGSHPWDASFARAHHRSKILQLLELSGVNSPQLEGRPEEGRIRLGYYYPVFHLDDLRVMMKLVFHYDQPCRTCDDPESLSSFTIDWPAGLDAHRGLHPAVPALRQHLPRDARIGGVTLPSGQTPPGAWAAGFGPLR